MSREKIIKETISRVFPKFKKTGDRNYESVNSEIIERIDFQLVICGSEEVFRTSYVISHLLIEEPRQIHKKELLINNPTLLSTINITPYNQEIATSSMKDGVLLNEVGNDKLGEHIRKMYNNHFFPSIEKYRTLEACNALLNRDIEVTKDILSWTNWQGIAFRKGLLAKAVNDQRYPEIIEAMKQYCEDRYQEGIKENIEQLCRLKPVFNKLFPEN